ncbi:CDP-glycerol glycerophosphotransferase family protein [Microbacterium fluvii]|uniref:CDP-glycerol glycerophosphotransferase family protein n=1 Tax=Microbacterium fluvii TaxID=415215 RepID=A0ABW2HCK1_9MICO|nr:CDP-glycerol glycerophosphotransferase family protein [Microbacterium fluvii]MCU4672217.1 CDP-glycerol glycerophosphotransferase family protein [Microbacterium fluvii]
MASFSFGAGNASKLLSIPLYAAGRLATLLIPRSDDRWVFGCGAGIGDGALALWEHAAGRHDMVWLTGSARDEADARARGIPTLPKTSLRGFWRTARARVVVVTHGFGDVNRYAVSGALVVQLWHGIPLKRIGLDSPETLRSSILPGSALVRRVLGEMYRSATRRIAVLPAASDLARGRLESAFALPDARVPVTGEPRVDVLSRATAPERRAAARAELTRLVGPVPDDTRAVLYAPTWRDGDSDPAVPTPAQWSRIVDVLDRHDAMLFVRSHPLGAGDYEPPAATSRVRGLSSDLVRDITPLLPAMDVLVTDYSSLVFDTSLVPLPVVFLAPDADEYGVRRGFYGRYRDVAGEKWATDWEEAAVQLAAVLGDESTRERALARARELDARVHAFRDGGSTERVYRVVLHLLRREPAA